MPRRSRLLAAGLADDAVEAWASEAARGIVARAIPPDKLTCYSTLGPRLSALVFHLVDSELLHLWPARALPNLLSVHLGGEDIDWRTMPDCDWPRLTTLSMQSGPGIAHGLLVWLARQDLPSLRQLIAERLDAPGSEIAALSRAQFWDNLEVLNVGYNPIDARSTWPAMPYLRVLRVPSTRTTHEDLRSLLAATPPQLAELDISGNPIDNEGSSAAPLD